MSVNLKSGCVLLCGSTSWFPVCRSSPSQNSPVCAEGPAPALPGADRPAAAAAAVTCLAVPAAVFLLVLAALLEGIEA